MPSSRYARSHHGTGRSAVAGDACTSVRALGLSRRLSLLGWPHRIATAQGPGNGFPGSSLWSLHRDPLAYMAGLQRRHGDLVHWRIGPQDVVMVARSDLARDVLVTHHRSFKKGPGFERAQIVLGQGLLTSEGDFHLRHRRMIQPAFHRRSVAAYGDVMVSEAARLRDGWHDGETVDVAEEMTRVTLSIVCRALFGHSVEDEAAAIGEAVTRVGGFFDYLVIALLPLLLRTPLPAVRRFKRGCAELDAATLRVVESRREGTAGAGRRSALDPARGPRSRGRPGRPDGRRGARRGRDADHGRTRDDGQRAQLAVVPARAAPRGRAAAARRDRPRARRAAADGGGRRAAALRRDGAAGGDAALPAGLGHRATGPARPGDRRLRRSPPAP